MFASHNARAGASFIEENHTEDFFKHSKLPVSSKGAKIQDVICHSHFEKALNTKLGKQAGVSADTKIPGSLNIAHTR